MELIDFIKTNDVDYTYNRVTEDFIPEIEKTLGIKLGSQLKKYILEYGYLGYSYVEMYGVNSIEGLKSDMIKRTISLNSRFEKTKGLIAVEDQGDGDYYLIDEKDLIYRFIAPNNMLIPQNIDLCEYILSRFITAQEV